VVAWTSVVSHACLRASRIEFLRVSASCLKLSNSFILARLQNQRCDHRSKEIILRNTSLKREMRDLQLGDDSSASKSCRKTYSSFTKFSASIHTKHAFTPARLTTTKTLSLLLSSHSTNCISSLRVTDEVTLFFRNKTGKYFKTFYLSDLFVHLTRRSTTADCIHTQDSRSFANYRGFTSDIHVNRVRIRRDRNERRKKC